MATFLVHLFELVLKNLNELIKTNYIDINNNNKLQTQQNKDNFNKKLKKKV